MNLFEFTPQKNAKKLTQVTGLLFIGAAVLMVMTMLLPNIPYRWAVQLLSVGMLAMGIFIMTRYVMKSFVYAVIKTDDGNDFTVTEIQNRHTVTVCRIGMSSIEKVFVADINDKQTDSDIKKLIKADKRKKFNYCADLFAQKYVCIFSCEAGTPIAIRLTWDESLEAVFNVKEEE